jgi:hypothetical protein
MACKIEINDKTYSDILGQVKDPVIAMRLYLQDSSDNMIAKTVLPAEKKVLNLIDSRLKKIDEKVQSKEGNKFVLKDEKNRLETIKKQLKEELKEGNTLYFYTTAKDYLAEIEKAVEGDITEDQLKSYYSATQMMQDFNSNFSSLEQELPSDTEISLKAKLLSLKLEPLMLKAALNYAKKQGFDLEEDDLKYLKETGVAAAYTLDLSTDGNLFMQYIHKVLKKASALRDFKLQEELKKILELEKGLTEDQMQKIFKTGKNGKKLRNQLVTRQSDEFFKDYYSKLNEINKLREDEDWLNFKTKRRDLLNWQSKNTAFVNPQYFTTDDESTKRTLFEKLVSEVGDEEYAQELLDNATNKWNSYNKSFEDWKEYVDRQTNKTDVQKAELIRNYEVEHSPDVYYSVLFGDREAAIKKYGISPKDHFSEAYIVFAPKASKTQYYSKEYAELQADKKTFAYYNHIKETMIKYKKFLPDYSKKDAYRNDFIFRAKSDMVELFQKNGMKGVTPKLTEKLINAFSSTFEHEYVSAVDSTGAAVGSVPVAKLMNIDAEIEKLENILAKKEMTGEERDITKKRLEELQTQYTIQPSKSMEQFLAMSLNFKFMSDISDEVELASEIVNSARSQQVNGTIGDPSNTKKRFNFAVDNILYGKSKLAEGVHKSKEDFQDNIFSPKDLVGLTSDKKKKAKELSKKILALKLETDDLIEKESAGQELTDEEKSKITTLKNLVGEYRNLNGKRTTTSSFVDSILSWLNLSTFGFAPFSGLVNATFGVVSAQNEASAQEYYTNKEFFKSFGIMMDSVKKYMSFNTVKQGTSDKVSTLLEKFGIVSDVLDIKHGKNQFKKSKAEKFSNPYTFLESSDFFISGLTVVSSMLSTKKYSLKTIEGKEIPIWDAFDSKGDWKSELFDSETNDAWNGDPLTGGSTKLAEYREYLKRLKAAAHAPFDRNDSMMLKKYAAGRLISSFKTFLPSFLNERFGSRMYSEALDSSREGRYRTFARLSKENEDLGSTIIGRAIKLLIKAEQSGLEPFEIANIKRTKNDIIWYSALVMFMIMLKGLADGPDDDDKIDKDNKIAKLLYNQIYTLSQDVSFALNITSFTSLTNKVVPAVSLLTNLNNAFAKSYNYIMNSDTYNSEKDEKEFEKMWKAWVKNIPFAKQITVFDSRAERLLESVNH